MSAFATFVSRKMIGALAVFTVIAAGFAGYAFTRSAMGAAGTESGTITAQTVDSHAFEAALADPASIETASADDPSGNWQQLHEDLEAARALEGDARRDAFAEIRSKAREGAYGPRIERRADRREIRHELFFNLLPDNLQADLTALREAPADRRKELRAEILEKALAGDYGPDVQKAAEQLLGLRHD